MYSKIMVPVDLKNLPSLEKALTAAADLGKHYGCEVCYVSVAAAAPSEVAHDPAEFARKLGAFAGEQASAHGIDTTSSALISHDPAVDLDATLLKAIGENGADLVVMGSHQPGLSEHFFSSNAGYVANHASVTVMVVR